MAGNQALQDWVEEIKKLTTPDQVVFCDGSQAQWDSLVRECVASGELIELNQQKLPGCYLHRSDKNDVARTEHLTFVLSRSPRPVGAWPAAARRAPWR